MLNCPHLFNRLKNIANMHREHDVSVFSNIVKNIEIDVFLKKSSKNRIVKNWKTSHREKHRIVKKSEHRPPLGGGASVRNPLPCNHILYSANLRIYLIISAVTQFTCWCYFYAFQFNLSAICWTWSFLSIVGDKNIV